MEKTCEFCGAPRPAVYCQADAAFLCLSCDAKVHSANALSGRHSRSLVCDSCRERPAHAQCLDHLMLLCRGCESRLHEFYPQHRKQIMSSFTGCPSAKHFAALWGFGSESSVSNDVKSNRLGSHAGFTSQKHMMVGNHQHEQKNYLIKQQVLELEKLQITEDTKRSSLSNRLGKNVTSSSTYSSSGKLDECLGQQSKQLDHCHNNELQSFENPSQELKADRFPSPMSQLDNLSCSSPGDPFWQYRSPVDNSQFWSQNLQDLGVCEDLGSLEDLNIPEVDVTFRNFDDLFKSDLDLTRALLEDDDIFSDNSGNSHSKTAEEVSAASSISVSKDIDSKNRYKGLSRSMEYSPHMMTSASFSRSRLSAESSGSECLDSGHSGNFTTHQVSYTMAEVQEPEGRENSHKERKKARLQRTQSQLAPRKAKTETHKKIKGEFVSIEGYKSETLNITKSY